METIGAPKKRLTRSNNKMIAGVVAGFAEYFDIDPSLLRVIYVVVSILSVGFPGLLIYLICWIFIPKQA
ncbi:PspC domain-containing protein [Sunxiuqinia dokdonensis]|uniref:PspC domain protein n=1 Tax=Sunxiuqinia dokdonensis TaxID=1409788 RepID=A0A0L8V9T6_9BACT|nr:PspC domain-containing protein [Sunxiuqinia dokdonensis]KOH45206.1 PspC domain protein [Sunxiuqinia dokdonensis]